MATETLSEMLPQEQDLPIEQFVQRGNDRDKGKDVPELVSPAAVADEPQETDSEPQPADEPFSAEPKKVDGRTREGRKSKIQQEIDEFTARKHAAKAEADAEEARLSRLRADREATERTPRTEPVVPQRPVAAAPNDFDGSDPRDPEPQLDDYKDKADPYTEWMLDKSDWRARKQFRQMQYREGQRAAAMQMDATWESRVAEARKSDPDIDRKLNSDTPLDRRITAHIKNHEMGPQIAAYLHDHKDFAQALLSLHPVEQIGRIGEIVGTLKSRAAAAKATSPASPAPISSAKQPPKLVGGSPVASPDVDDDEESLSVDDFIRRGNKKDPRYSRRA